MKRNKSENSSINKDGTPLFVVMNDEGRKCVERAALREGMTKAAYVREVFKVATKVSLARLAALIEKEIEKEGK